MRSVGDLATAELRAAMGELCLITNDSGEGTLAEVIAAEDQVCQLMPFESVTGLAPGMSVIGLNRQVAVPVGEALRGRVLDGLGKPLDGQPLPSRVRRRVTSRAPLGSLQRQRIRQPLCTGQRAIDGLLTIGRGQRIGLFAGSGVGKSTLLGEIAKGTDADVNVIALVGERSREVVPFLEDCLGPDGLSRSVVVVATAEQTPVMKIQAVKTALTIAEQFREQRAHGLFFLDSLTRLAQAQRDLGIARGEPVGNRGYPPTVFSQMATTLERLGNSQHGSLTGILTVLVEGDDLHDPIADAARSILDGHIVLDRTLADIGHFPAINVLKSLSRLAHEITTPSQQLAAARLRTDLARLAEVRDLIQVGLYQPGASPEVDQALARQPRIEEFLRQQLGETSTTAQTTHRLERLFPEDPN